MYTNLAFAQTESNPSDNSSYNILAKAVHEVIRKVSVPPPTRETFRPFKAGSSVPDILRAAGVPTRDTGSGLFVLEYDFADGKSCVVGTKNLRGKAMYVTCRESD